MLEERRSRLSITRQILRKQYDRLKPEQRTGLVFKSPDLRACNYALEVWCKNAGITGIAILLQDNQVEAVTVVMLMGVSKMKHVLATYRHLRPKNVEEVLRKLPMPIDSSQDEYPFPWEWSQQMSVINTGGLCQ
ncbi:hypothetical protein DVR12_03570 [Chitinophaga silvatica]|uniref:Uncharacterized protein n=1 Tax=Chitinophaga silvatica TaxID=2282649 RepID=A0A3E1YHF5_9BACT|nr:hypothetical protein [Chitinophaga silvatica]RFS26875.1 hypothetical protein DVR12_03570 [Chitinophaga silvatica]